jgi:hypothetical protein
LLVNQGIANLPTSRASQNVIFRNTTENARDSNSSNHKRWNEQVAKPSVTLADVRRIAEARIIDIKYLSSINIDVPP